MAAASGSPPMDVDDVQPHTLGDHGLVLVLPADGDMAKVDYESEAVPVSAPHHRSDTLCRGGALPWEEASRRRSG